MDKVRVLDASNRNWLWLKNEFGKGVLGSSWKLWVGERRRVEIGLQPGL